MLRGVNREYLDEHDLQLLSLRLVNFNPDMDK